MAEWSKAHAWKVCRRETVSWVRIPPSPPPYPYYLCYRYFCRYSCAISGVYNSVVRLMPDISSHFSDNYRQTSVGHLPRVGFPCFLGLTGNLTGNVPLSHSWTACFQPCSSTRFLKLWPSGVCHDINSAC